MTTDTLNTSKASGLSYDDLLTDCDRSTRYHHERVAFCKTVYLSIQFIIFALSSVAVANVILSTFGEWIDKWLWAVISLLALFSLVYNPAERQNIHERLYQSFMKLAGDICADPNPDEKTLIKWTKDMHVLYAQEPPVYGALLAQCDNKVTISLNAGEGYLVDLSLRHRLLRNIFKFQGTNFSNRNQTPNIAQET